MTIIRRASLVLAALSAAVVVVAAAPATKMQYPATERVEQVDEYHGEKVADPYRWLEDLDSPEVAAWVAARLAKRPTCLSRRS